ncbi:hypothetical protein ACCO45_005316 [Purpureocillium lilacinum]|uniref:Uncharacterized protein n=1 Tax=Purpureocillium lilacinum TaxID=33203 RepID=A0ACC4DV50_PURLI
MADPLLTSLCAICHVSAPKYKCPRCNIQTCSVQCIKKHKAWSECSGERDPTTYVPPAQLRTVAGVNHDYNFLHGLGMSMERTERVFVQDKKIMREEDLRPKTAGGNAEAREKRFERHLAHRLRQLNVHVVCAPLGMARQKENNTTFNRRTGTVNWQVEWLLLDGDDQFASEHQTQAVPTRILSKVLEDTPLHRAFQEARSERKKAETGQPRKAMSDERTSEPQEPYTSIWNYLAYPADLPRHEFQFYLAGPPARSDLPRTVTSLETEDCLRNILSNTTLHPGAERGGAFVAGQKRAPGPERGGGDQRSSKRQKEDSKEIVKTESGSEEGEALEDAAAVDGPGSDGEALEQGEEAAGEEDDEVDEDDGDDSTSSSGTDSESD